MQDKPNDSLKITAVTPEQAAKILATSYGRRITEDQVRQIAEDADLLRPDGTLNLIEYTAWLAREVSNG